jgi:hypothetical protein
MGCDRLFLALVTISLGTAAASSATAAAPPVTVPASAPAPLGVTYAGWRGQYADADRRLAAFKEIGFRIVSFVPTYGYAGLNKIDLATGPDAHELARAVEAASRAGLAVVVKPHLDPLAYSPGFDQFRSENDSWRVACPWRGFFDLDPMSDDYRKGVVFAALGALRAAFDALGAPPPTPVRLEVGAELMNSEVYTPERWVELLAATKKERHRLGLDRSVVLSHNFTHHVEIPDDFVARMTAAGRAALARYIRGLDALSLSQYMDLTAAMPAAERGQRLPSADEVAQALVLHERSFRERILVGALGLRPSEIPPLHIGEYGVGRGGLRHPNLWAGDASPAQEQELAREIARGHEGLVRYLALPEGRTAQSAVLWVTGPHYDIFGWETPKHAIPDAAAAIRGSLQAVTQR